MNIANFIYKWKKYFVLVEGVLFIITFMFFVDMAAGLRSSTGSVKNDINDITLAENVEISSQWEEIDLTNMSFPRKEINYISIVVNSPYFILVGKNRGIRSPNGEVFLPQIAVEDFEGIRCDLKFAGRRGENTAYFWDIGETRCFSEPKKYKTLLIRSSFTFKARKILWSGFNLRDMK
ncbi:MAG TPA: hypothetical protein PKD24_05775 [Pyrinomonadaceae bacterium]|nr:hypothetical protein [Pyrinomonadaceae bacterium]HMP65335.1 hypothetical protein [Pyrinomonadaceae bacterium]